jgi:hypothetical protein
MAVKKSGTRAGATYGSAATFLAISATLSNPNRPFAAHQAGARKTVIVRTLSRSENRKESPCRGNEPLKYFFFAGIAATRATRKVQPLIFSLEQLIEQLVCHRPHNNPLQPT